MHNREELRTPEALLDAAVGLLHLSDAPKASCAKAGAILADYIRESGARRSYDGGAPSGGGLNNQWRDEYYKEATYGDLLNHVCFSLAIMWAHTEDFGANLWRDASLAEHALPADAVQYKKLKSHLQTELKNVGIEPAIAEKMIEALEKQTLLSWGFSSNALAQFDSAVLSDGTDISIPTTDGRQRK